MDEHYVSESSRTVKHRPARASSIDSTVGAERLDKRDTCEMTDQTVLDATASGSTSSGDSDALIVEPCQRVDGKVDADVEVARLPRHGVASGFV